MSTILIVLWREITVRLKNWRFWLGTLSFPLLIFLGLAIPFLLEHLSQEKVTKVLVVGSLPLPEHTGTFEFLPIPAAFADSLRSLLEEDLLLLILPTDPLLSEVCTVYTASTLPAARMEALEKVLTEAFRAHRQSRLQVTSEALARVLTPPRIQVYKVSEEGPTRYSASLATTIGMFTGIALFVMLIGGGYQILASVLEEKSNRLVEYLLLSAAPTQILTGKVLAALVLSVFQVGVWGIALLLGGGLTARGGLPLPDEAKSQAFMGALAGQLQAIPWLWVMGFALLGLLLYAFLYAAAGATSDSVTELSPLSQAIQWPLLLSVMALPTLTVAGEGPVLVFLSYFPLTSPLYMPVRLIAAPIPLWEAPLSLVLLSGTVIATQRLAARIYKHALLLYGQKLSWKAIWQIIRG